MKEMQIHNLDINTFLFVFNHKVNKKKVVENGPWIIISNHLIIKEWQPDVTFDEINFLTSIF